MVRAPPARPHLVLLLEAVPFGTLHLCDVLQQVGHSDSRVQLSRLIGQRLPLRLALLVVGLDQATGFTGHSVAVVWGRSRRQNMTINRSDECCAQTDTRYEHVGCLDGPKLGQNPDLDSDRPDRLWAV